VRKLLMLACVGLAGAGVAILPSLGAAQGTTASFTADDGVNAFFGVHSWFVTGTTSTAATIAPGGTVSFSYPAGTSSHNVDFTGALKPSACTQATAPPGYQIKAVPPLPYTPEPPSWTGSCRFDTPGTYTFQCDLHGAAMSGTVTVGTAATTPPPTSTPTTTTGGTTTQTFVEPHFPGAASSLRAAAVQRGTLVRGQIHVTASGMRLVADLYTTGRPAVRLGRTTLHGVGAGTRHFTVRLYASGQRRLRRRHRLTLALRVQALGAGLGPSVLSRHVTLLG
jgi:plastocyanin